MANIAFIGLGQMGAPMVLNLVRCGNRVNAYDILPVAREAIAKHGVNVVNTIDEALANADIVISMLSLSDQVRSLYLGAGENSQPAITAKEDGVFKKLNKATLIIDCSTIPVEEAKKLAKQAQEFGHEYVDAPVSGSIGGAISASLSFFVGSSDNTYNDVKKILLCMGSKVFHAGDTGAGQGAKICNNMMLGILMSGSAEALNLGKKNGVDPAVLSDIMIENSGRNWALEVYNPYPGVLSVGVPSNRKYARGFSSNNMYKDLNLALTVAKQSGVNIPMGERATQLYQKHSAEHGDKDFSSIMALHDPAVLNN